MELVLFSGCDMIVFYIWDRQLHFPPYRSNFFLLFSFEIVSSRLNYFIPQVLVVIKAEHKAHRDQKVL